MSRAIILYGATDLGVSEFPADLLWRTKFSVPDPVFFFEIADKKVLALSPLEIGRGEKEAKVDKIISLKTYEDKAKELNLPILVAILKDFHVDEVIVSETVRTSLFMELRENIKYEIVRLLFTIQLVEEEEQNRQMQQLKENMKDENEHVLNAPSMTSSKEKKIARNEPCPCGSGKKYKQCCGKSGPKKGLLAQ